MPRNMSFAKTTEQVRAGTKTVTRRLGWWFLKPGDIVNAVEKCRGLKKGEKVKLIRQIRIVSVRGETLSDVNGRECALEGFPEMRAEDFRRMFLSMHPRWDRTTRINRIEFEYI
jgi:hypothetical protein